MYAHRKEFVGTPTNCGILIEEYKENYRNIEPY
jgi:hypothetical protein